MRLPVIRGVIERRLLINYRVDPDILARLLPRPFRPQLVHGSGMAGICLIRLGQVRPRGFPQWLGIGSENAAQRAAVEWDEGNERRTGVYVLRRDTNSHVNALAGGRVFPGVHHHGIFRVRETAQRFEVGVTSDDRQAAVRVAAKVADDWPADSVFASLEEASSFFAAGSLGYSPSITAGQFQGLELRCQSWRVEPLAIESAQSSLFDDAAIFPRGSIALDNGLLMRGVEHEWKTRGDLCCGATAQLGSGAPAYAMAVAGNRLEVTASRT